MSIFTKILLTLGSVIVFMLIGGIFIGTGNEKPFRFFSMFLIVGLFGAIRAIWKNNGKA